MYYRLIEFITPAWLGLSRLPTIYYRVHYASMVRFIKVANYLLSYYRVHYASMVRFIKVANYLL